MSTSEPPGAVVSSTTLQLIMADDFAANSFPGDSTVNLSRGNMLPASQNEEIVESIFKPPDSDDNYCIQPYAVGYQDGDGDYDSKSTKHDDNTSIQPYAVGYQDKDDNYADNSSTFQTSPTDGEVQPYAVAYLQHENVAFGLGGAKTDETFQKSEAEAAGSNDIPVNTAGPDSFEDDTDTLVGYDNSIHQNQRPLCPNLVYARNKLDTDSMYTPNEVNPNTVYLQPTGNTSFINQQYAMDQALTYPQNAGKTSPIYPENSYPIYPQNTVNTNPIFLQNTGNSNVMDEPNVVPESARPTDGDDNPCIQPYAPYAVRYEEKHDDKHRKRDDNSTIQPYAVKYQEKDDEDNNKHTKRDGTACIQPYAVKYQEKDDEDNNKHTKRFVENNTNLRQARHPLKTLHPNPTRAQNVLNPNPTNAVLNAMMPNQMYAQNAQIPDQRNAQNAPIPNQMYVANVHPRRANGRRCLRLATFFKTAIVVLSLILGGTITGVSFRARARDVQMPSFTNGPLWTTETTQSLTSFSSQGAYIGNVKPQKIVLVLRRGSDPAGAKYRVAVSADNEIFVADYYNERVQVFSMDGVFLRLFPTVVPNDNEKPRMRPSGVAIDRNGLLWVTGSQNIKEHTHAVRVVQYDRNGVVMKTFKAQPIKYAPDIAFDVFNIKILLSGSGIVRMLHPNGSFYHSFQIETQWASPHLTTDKEGNIFVSNPTSSFVEVYNQSGHLLFKFGGFGRAEGQLCYPRGIVIDSSGSILVANEENDRVDMFTRLGKFVRTVVNVTRPGGLAVGPDGDLVVTTHWYLAVTIVPHQMLYP
ncbi:hypothetical protein Bbelb_022310 [Branchiostoma belcheri]|nr:hypothetical protein Bbelb_022310 [Branchiostoma belcheri]